MTDAKSAWHEASERLGSLGTRLKTHYEQQRGQDVDQAKAEVREALHRLTGALDDAFDAIGTAARDDAVKSDVKQVGQSLVAALGATFSEVSAEVQRTFASRTGGGTGKTRPSPTPTTGTEPPPKASDPDPSPASRADSGEGQQPEADGEKPPKVEP
jgi:chromosome segregation ATPase